MIISNIMKRAKQLRRCLIIGLASMSILGLTGCTDKSPSLSSQLSNYLINSSTMSKIARNQFNNTLGYDCGKQANSSDIVLHNEHVGFSDGNSDSSDNKDIKGYAFDWHNDYKPKFYEAYQNDRYINDFVTPSDLVYDSHHEPSIKYHINNRNRTLALSSTVNADTITIIYKLKKAMNYFNSEESYEFSPINMKCTNKYNHVYRHDKNHKIDLTLNVHNNNWDKIS